MLYCLTFVLIITKGTSINDVTLTEEKGVREIVTVSDKRERGGKKKCNIAHFDLNKKL